MGAGESTVDPSQVPGFNPRQRLENAERKRRQQGPSDVDHIRAIRQESETGRKGPEEGELEGTVDITKLLNDLEKKRQADELSEDGGDLSGFPNGEGNSEETSSSDSDEEDEHGRYHHEVKEEEKNESLSTLSSLAHPISIEGDCSVGSRLRFRDNSPNALTFPVSKIIWSLSAEPNNQTSFKVIPSNEGPKFDIPLGSVSHYIQVSATRRVENQLRGTYEQDVEGGVYDPHVGKARHVDIGRERKFTDVVSTAVTGPVLIANSWANSILRALSEGHIECVVRLWDELVPSKDEIEEEGERKKSFKIDKVPATLRADYKRIEFEYEIPPKKKAPRTVGNTVLFSLEWLSQIIQGLPTNSEASATDLEKQLSTITGPVVARFRMKTITFRPTSADRCLMMVLKLRKKGYSHTKMVQDLVRMDIDPQIGRDCLLYILLAFKAAVSYKCEDPAEWSKALNSGDTDKAKNLIRNFLEDLTEKSSRDAMTYDPGMPATPYKF